MSPFIKNVAEILVLLLQSKSPLFYFSLNYIQVYFLWHKLSSLSQLEMSFNTLGTARFIIRSLLQLWIAYKSKQLSCIKLEQCYTFWEYYIWSEYCRLNYKPKSTATYTLAQRSFSLNFFQRNKPRMAAPHVTLGVMIYS